MSWQEEALSRYYNRELNFIDGTAEFHAICQRAIPRGSRILEIGAGPSNPTSDFLGSLGTLTGLDVDAAARGNRALAATEVFDGGHFPFDNGSFDACVSNYVLEHVADTGLHLREVQRVLAPGGVYVARTPNRYHYVALVSWLTPHWFHERVANRLRGLPADSHDPYPTVYALNSRGAFLKAAPAAGFKIEELRMVEKEPSYGMASRLMFYPFMAYERVVNSSDAFRGLRANIFAVLRKPGV